MNYRKLISTIDVEILNKILFPKSKQIIVFDTAGIADSCSMEKTIYVKSLEKLKFLLNEINEEFTLVNFSSESITNFKKHSRLTGILDFSKSKNNTFTKYFFINNPDGSMRWVFPKSNSSASFLNLYNSSGWKAKLFSTAAKCLNAINFLEPIISGNFSVFIKDEKGFQSSFGEILFDDFSIFTGTIGENRKAIISLSKNKRCTHFVKVPLTEASSKLVKNEFEQLNKLGEITYSSTSLPEVIFNESRIVISNVQPLLKKENQNWSKTHWESLRELYQSSHQEKMINETSFWKTIEDGIDFFQKPYFLQNGLEADIVEKLKQYSDKLFNQINKNNLIPVGIGHGDFTPWNMYVGQKKLHIYDWEMSQSDYPLLFDFFHYFFQKGILIEKQDFRNIKKSIQSQLKELESQQILHSFKINWEEHFQLYLLYIVCYYLPKYISQPQLHDQVHWLVNNWLEALQSFDKKTIVKEMSEF